MDIPYISQWQTGADAYRTDCGPTCVAMLLVWKGLLGNLTVNALSRETALVQADDGLSCAGVTTLALAHSLDCAVETGLTVPKLQAHIAAGEPVILLIWYGAISERQDLNDVNGLHFVIACGDDGSHILVNDPDRLRGTTWGTNVPIPYASIETALAKAWDTTGANRSGIVCRGVHTRTVSHTAVTTDALRLRVAPNTSAATIAAMPPGTTVNVLDDAPQTANGYTWLRVQYGALVGWCVTLYLSLPATGYDVSHHNDVDIVTLAQNAAFALHKASEGTYSTDSAYPGRKAAVQAWKNDYPWGAYHFGTGGDVLTQVDKFLAAAAPDGHTVLALDLEANPDTAPDSEGSMTLHQAAQFVQAVKDKTGQWPLLYTRANYIDPMGDGSAQAKADFTVLANCPLWITSQSTPPRLPANWSMWAIQQYDQRTTPGARALIDADRFNGGDVGAWWKAHAAAPLAEVKAAWVNDSDGINVRSGPGTSYRVIGGLVNRTPIGVTDARITANAHPWQRLVNAPKPALVGGYVAGDLLSFDAPPLARKTAAGLHIHQGSLNAQAMETTILDMARRGLINGATVIDNPGLANALVAAGVGYVVHRHYIEWTAVTENTQQRGREVFDMLYPWHRDTDPRVIIQLANEENIHPDDQFYIGAMMQAVKTGRRLVIFNDSVGTTEDDHWINRRAALECAKQTNSYVGLHAYGRIDGLYHPMTAWDNPGDWRYYAGRFEHLYGLIPDVQPDLILTEAGAGGFQQDAGLDNFLRDYQAMGEIAKQYPYLKTYNWWSAGCGNPAYKFERDDLDGWLPALENALATKQPIPA